MSRKSRGRFSDQARAPMRKRRRHPDPFDRDVTLDRQRIDKWLWHARLVRTRTAAAALAGSGQVRLNGERVTEASRNVRLGDVVTVALDRSVRILKVAGFAERRGGAESARSLVENLMPVPATSPPEALSGVRAPGAGRPTKRDRRAIGQLKGEDWA